MLQSKPFRKFPRETPRQRAIFEQKMHSVTRFLGKSLEILQIAFLFYSCEWVLLGSKDWNNKSKTTLQLQAV